RNAFALQCAVASLLSASTSMMAVMVPLYATSLGLGAEWLGLLVAMPGMFPVLLAIPASRIVDRLGPAKWLFVGMLGMASAPVSLLLLPGVVGLAASRLLVGFFQLFVTLSGQSLVAGLTNGRSHQSNFAAYSTLLALGRMFGPILAGFIIDTAGFRASFVATLTILLLAGVGAYLVMLGNSHTGSGTRVGLGTGRSSVRSVVSNVGFQMAVLSSSGIFLALTMREAFMPVMMQDLGMSATTIGTLVSLGSLTSVLIRPIIPRVTTALRGTARTSVAGMAAVAVGVGLLALAPLVGASTLFFGVLAVVTGFGSGVGFPLSIVSVATHVPLDQRGLALSLRLSSNHLVELTAPVLGGLLVAAAGYSAGFAAAGAILALLTLLAVGRVKGYELQDDKTG
ncbi:MAG TPA: MFS transporter, partial [Trueperaceae bacterium]|nr:MFS transporter [Trueperaceae bacterium]